MTKTPGPIARPSRHPALAALDVIGGVVLLLTGLGIGVIAIATMGVYPQLLEGCGAVEGVVCDVTYVQGVTVGVTIVTILAWALGAGFFLVRSIQRRLAFVWPLIAFVVIVAAFWGGTALVSLSLPGVTP